MRSLDLADLTMANTRNVFGCAHDHVVRRGASRRDYLGFLSGRVGMIGGARIWSSVHGAYAIGTRSR